MYSQKATQIKEIKYVLERLNQDAVYELKTLFGNNYKNEVLKIIQSVGNEKFIIKLKKTNEPVGLFGIIPQKGTRACGIFFLTTDNLHKGNKIILLRRAKEQIAIWETKYKCIMDSCYKKNETIVKWLTLLGFKPSNELQDNDFQIYYKGEIDEYKY